jgi:hypothetical protein
MCVPPSVLRTCRAALPGAAFWRRKVPRLRAQAVRGGGAQVYNWDNRDKVAEDEAAFEERQRAEHEQAVQRARDARRAQLLQRTRPATAVSAPPEMQVCAMRPSAAFTLLLLRLSGAGGVRYRR